MTILGKILFLVTASIILNQTFISNNWKVEGGFYGISRLSLYSDINQEGDYYFMRVGSQCTRVPEGIQERASSVDTHETCLMLCRLPHCRSCVRVHPGSAGHQDLRDVEMNDQVVSVRACFGNEIDIH